MRDRLTELDPIVNTTVSILFPKTPESPDLISIIIITAGKDRVYKLIHFWAFI